MTHDPLDEHPQASGGMCRGRAQPVQCLEARDLFGQSTPLRTWRMVGNHDDEVHVSKSRLNPGQIANRTQVRV